MTLSAKSLTAIDRIPVELVAPELVGLGRNALRGSGAECPKKANSLVKVMTEPQLR